MSREYFAKYYPYGVACASEADTYVRFASKAHRDSVVVAKPRNYEACARKDIPKNKAIIDYRRM